MTNERAHQLNIFTDWGVFSCQSCTAFTHFADLSEYGGLILCESCTKKAKQKETKHQQRRLFDEQTELFQ